MSIATRLAAEIENDKSGDPYKIIANCPDRTELRSYGENFSLQIFTDNSGILYTSNPDGYWILVSDCSNYPVEGRVSPDDPDTYFSEGFMIFDESPVKQPDDKGFIQIAAGFPPNDHEK